MLLRNALGFIPRLSNGKPSYGNGGKYCRVCRSLIPQDAAFCPSCGSAQEAITRESCPPTRRGGLAKVILSNYRRIRLLLVLLSLVLFIFTFLMGTLTRLSMDEAQTILQEFEETLGTRPGVTTIIMNNITFCLLFFIPSSERST